MGPRLDRPDGSDLAAKAVEKAVLVAKEIGAKITALTVTEPFHLLSVEPSQLEYTSIEYKKHAQAYAEKVLGMVSAAAEIQCRFALAHLPLIVHREPLSRFGVRPPLNSRWASAIDKHGDLRVRVSTLTVSLPRTTAETPRRPCEAITIKSHFLAEAASSELLKDKGVLIVSPVGPLGASDFEHLAGEIDPYIEQNGRLHGLMIHAESFPGWKDFAALLSHLKFVRDHQSKIEKVAAVSDSSFLAIMPSVISHFVKAQVKHFNYDDKDKALEWLAAR